MTTIIRHNCKILRKDLQCKDKKKHCNYTTPVVTEQSKELKGIATEFLRALNSVPKKDQY